MGVGTSAGEESTLDLHKAKSYPVKSFDLQSPRSTTQSTSQPQSQQQSQLQSRTQSQPQLQTQPQTNTRPQGNNQDSNF